MNTRQGLLLSTSVAAMLSLGAAGCDKASEYPSASSGNDSMDAAADGMTVAGAEQATSDAWITTKVKSVLLADSVSKGLDVNVTTTDGIVALEGVLKDQQTIDHVKQVAAGVEHVAAVDTSALTIER